MKRQGQERTRRPRPTCPACGAEVQRAGYCQACRPKPKYPRKKVLRKAAQKKLPVFRYAPGTFDVMQRKWSV